MYTAECVVIATTSRESGNWDKRNPNDTNWHKNLGCSDLLTWPQIEQGAFCFNVCKQWYMFTRADVLTIPPPGLMLMTSILGMTRCGSNWQRENHGVWKFWVTVMAKLINHSLLCPCISSLQTGCLVVGSSLSWLGCESATFQAHGTGWSMSLLALLTQSRWD